MQILATNARCLRELCKPRAHPYGRAVCCVDATGAGARAAVLIHPRWAQNRQPHRQILPSAALESSTVTKEMRLRAQSRAANDRCGVLSRGANGGGDG